MKEWTLVLALIGTFGCGVENNPEPTANKKEVWVCHNPLSELHGSACAEKINVVRGEYEECYWVGHRRVKKAFCWLLKKKDCVGDLSFEWQEENCHLFGDMAE